MPPEELDEELLQVPNNEITILGVIFESPIVIIKRDITHLHKYPIDI